MKKIIKAIQDNLDLKNKILANAVLLTKIEASHQTIVNTLQSGGCVFFCGNGGSAADAQHMAAELTGKYYLKRRALAAMALHTDTSSLTAIANDFGYEHVFQRQIEAHAKKGDVLVGLSTSGNSQNIIQAFESAKEIGCICISLTGRGGGKLKKLSDICIEIDSNDTPRIQECHTLIGHIICQLVEESFFGNKNEN